MSPPRVIAVLSDTDDGSNGGEMIDYCRIFEVRFFDHTACNDKLLAARAVAVTCRHPALFFFVFLRSTVVGVGEAALQEREGG